MEGFSKYAYVLLSCSLGVAFWIAIAASLDMDYAVERFTVADACVKAVRTPAASVLQGDCLWFFVSVGLACATLFIAKSSVRIVVVAIALLASLPAGSLPTPMLALAFPFYFFTGSDGETWGEAWPAMSAMGVWILASLAYVAIQWACCLKRKKVLRT